MANSEKSTVGTVFDIKEFSVFDGPGVRVTVFLKGCPLRCKWCHNPEGLKREPQIMVSAACNGCGACNVAGCALRESGGAGECNGCGRCALLCPNGYRRLSGTQYTPDELAAKIMKYKPFFNPEGGVTFSGGEPTMQAIQTCGYCAESVFGRVLRLTDFVFFDIKHTDSEKHREYTGVDNRIILSNLEQLKRSEKPFIARVPLIAGVNDDAVNLTNTAEILRDAKSLLRVELLPYNGAAGAKYKMTGQDYPFDFRAPTAPDLSPFKRLGIEARVL